MSSIPPAIISSLATPVAQREQARNLEATREASAEASKKLVGGPDALIEVEVEATDGDTQVHTDAGGLGSQGRYDRPSDDEQQDSKDQPTVIIDEEGQAHIDISI